MVKSRISAGLNRLSTWPEYLTAGLLLLGPINYRLCSAPRPTGINFNFRGFTAAETVSNVEAYGTGIKMQVGNLVKPGISVDRIPVLALQNIVPF